MMKHPRFLPVLLLITALLFGCASNLRTSPPPERLPQAREDFPGAPPLPPGYATRADLKQALDAGAHAQVEMKSIEHPATVTVEKGVAYGKTPQGLLTLDLYRPARIPAPAPGLVFVHGGAWEKKGKDYFAYWAMRFAEEGYVCASIEYRTSDEAPFPAAIEDTKGAVEWMRAHALDLGVDPTRIALIGQSAGAHIALMAAYTASKAPPQEGEAALALESEVQAVVAFYGPTDLTRADPLRESEVLQRFLGASYDDNPELYRQASPLHNLTRHAPPTLIFHGTIDEVVPVEHADVLVAALQKAGVPVWYDRQEGWHHGMEAIAAINERALYIMDAFLEEHLAEAAQ